MHRMVNGKRVEMTPEEERQHLEWQSAKQTEIENTLQAKAAADEAKAMRKQAIAQKLGITIDELQLLTER